MFRPPLSSSSKEKILSWQTGEWQTAFRPSSYTTCLAAIVPVFFSGTLPKVKPTIRRKTEICVKDRVPEAVIFSE
jgi:hypothetical protein